MIVRCTRYSTIHSTSIHTCTCGPYTLQYEPRCGGSVGQTWFGQSRTCRTPARSPISVDSAVPFSVHQHHQRRPRFWVSRTCARAGHSIDPPRPPARLPARRCVWCYTGTKKQHCAGEEFPLFFHTISFTVILERLGNLLQRFDSAENG